MLYDEINLIENAINEILYSEDPINLELIDNLIKAKNETIERGLEALCKIRVRKMAEISGFAAEIKRLSEKSSRETTALKRLENYIFDVYKRAGVDKMTAGTFTVGKRISSQVWVSDTFNNPQYMRTKTIVEPDKTAIKDAIKAGAQIDGAAIVTKENLSIK